MFHKLIIERKVKREYERVDGLVGERNRIEEAVKRGQRERRQRIRGRI
jgi:hypothetical protein